MAKRELQTAPTTEPVTISELRTHLRVDGFDEDTYITTLGLAARRWVESYTRSALITQTWDQSYDGLSDPMKLDKPPVSSITSVSYTDTAGDSQTLAATYYELGEIDGASVVRAKYNQTYPSTRGHEDVVTVRYVTGYGAASAVPDGIKHAIKLIVAQLFENREPTILGMTITQVPFAVKALLEEYRYWESVP